MLDAQLPPALAAWMVETFGVNAISLKELGIRDAKDIEIFEAAQQDSLVIITKDSDFVDLVCSGGIFFKNKIEFLRNRRSRS